MFNLQQTIQKWYMCALHTHIRLSNHEKMSIKKYIYIFI
jgi:hypothetical protein